MMRSWKTVLAILAEVVCLVQNAESFVVVPNSINQKSGFPGNTRTPVSLHVTSKQAADDLVDAFKKKFSARRKKRPIDEKVLRKTFTEMAKVYGLENAIVMANTELRTLEMDPSYFKGTYDIFCETFGKEDAIEMVKRNPGLLATAPDGYGSAETAGPETMFLSYVVAATRPAGPLLLSLLISLLLLPSFELLTGIPVRDSLFKS